MHVAAEFSPNGNLFAQLNTDGSLKIWNTETNELAQEYIPNLHLTSPCTCLLWVTMRSGAGGSGVSNEQKARKKQRLTLDHEELLLYIALGTSKGRISLYSYNHGKIEKHLNGEGHSGNVTSITNGSDDSILYSCGDDSKIILWNINDGKQLNSWKIDNDNLSSIMYMKNSNSLVIGSRNLKLWSINESIVKQKFTGHKSNIQLLKYFKIDTNFYILSGSSMDRVLSLWHCQIGKTFKNSVASFLLSDSPIYLNCHFNTTIKMVQIVAVTKSGAVHIFHIDDKRLKLNKSIKSNFTIDIASNSEPVEPIPILTANFKFGKGTNNILIGYGNQILRFENIEQNFKEKNNVLIRDDPVKAVKVTANQKERNLKTLTPIINENSIAYQTPTILPHKHFKSMDIPIETRLDNLSLKTGNLPPAKNMVQLLMQGLQSSDANILRTVFTTTNEDAIKLTLQTLKPQYIPRLLEELTLLAGKKATSVMTAVTWLNILLVTHASQLMAFGADDLFSKFGPLIGFIEHRAMNIKSISKLSGRLDLLLTQIKRNTDDEILDDENLLVYEDVDSEASDSDMDFANEYDNDNENNITEWKPDGTDDDVDDDNNDSNGDDVDDSKDEDEDEDEDEDDEEDEKMNISN